MFPGKRNTTKLTMMDDQGIDVISSSLYIARSLSDGIHIDSNSLYTSSNSIKVHKTDYENDSIVEGNVSLEIIQGGFALPSRDGLGEIHSSLLSV